MHSTFQSAQVASPRADTTRAAAADLLAEFAANPWGPHGDELQAVLNHMRAAPVAGKLVVLMITPHSAWQLARLPSRRGAAPEPFGPVYTSLAEIEVAAFRIRLGEATS